MENATSVPAIAVTAAVGAVVLLFILLCNIARKPQEEKEGEEKQEEKTEKKEITVTKKTKPATKSRKGQASFSHPWLASSLKGHSSPILDFDFSPNGKYVITVAEDRSIMLWSAKEFEQKEHKFIRGTVELDHATRVRYSPDSKAFIVSLANHNTVRIFRIGKKEDGSPGNITAALDFPKKHKSDIIHIGIASSGKFIMTCSGDTTLIVWSIKGDVLSEIDTHHMNNTYAAVSPCGRFVASSGFTADIKVWEVCFLKSGDFQEVKRAFELKGHSAGVHCFSFNNDSTRMASVSKDGTWKYWDTNVRYMNQDPYLLYNGKLYGTGPSLIALSLDGRSVAVAQELAYIPKNENTTGKPIHLHTSIRYDMNQDPYLLYTGKLYGTGPSLIALSPDGRSVAVAQESAITICNSLTGDDEEHIENVHSGLSSHIGFDVTGRYFLSAGDKHIHILHNVTGYKATIEELIETEKKASGQAMKERVRQQIQDARDALKRILGEANGHVVSK